MSPHATPPRPRARLLLAGDRFEPEPSTIWTDRRSLFVQYFPKEES